MPNYCTKIFTLHCVGGTFVEWDETADLVRQSVIGLLYQPRVIDDDGCRAVSGMRIGKGNRGTLRKSAQAPLRPSQIPRDLTRVEPRSPR
jgi:hypothetical protein